MTAAAQRERVWLPPTATGRVGFRSGDARWLVRRAATATAMPIGRATRRARREAQRVDRRRPLRVGRPASRNRGGRPGTRWVVRHEWSPLDAQRDAAASGAAAVAGLSWMFIEWAHNGKPTLLGVVSGAVGGLVAITPAAGFVSPAGAFFIGLIAGAVCYWGAAILKPMLGYDDSLDVFAVHGLGGITGAILTGVFAVEAIGGTAGALEGNSAQIVIQLKGIVATVLWSGIASAIILFVIDKVIGLRVDPDAEAEGLDIHQHGERIN